MYLHTFVCLEAISCLPTIQTSVEFLNFEELIIFVSFIHSETMELHFFAVVLVDISSFGKTNKQTKTKL